MAALFDLVSKARPAFEPSGGQHLSPASGFHSLEKAMLFFPLQFLRLIGSFQRQYPPFGEDRTRVPLPLQNDIISHAFGICQEIVPKNSFFVLC